MTDPSDLPSVLTVPEVAKILRRGLRQTYEACRTGEIPALRLGTTWRIPRDRLLAMLEGDPTPPEAA